MKKFNCPKCPAEGNKLIECVLEGTHFQTVESIDADGLVIYSPLESEAMVDRFQCENCGYIFRMKIDKDDRCKHCKDIIQNNIYGCDECPHCGNNLEIVDNEEDLLQWIEENC